MKTSADEMDRVKFLQEAAIMAQFKHPNVITLYGVVSTRGTVSLGDILLMSSGELGGMIARVCSIGTCRT